MKWQGITYRGLTIHQLQALHRFVNLTGGVQCIPQQGASGWTVRAAWPEGSPAQLAQLP